MQIVIVNDNADTAARLREQVVILHLPDEGDVLLTVHVSRLRKNFAQASLADHLVRTVNGAGYTLGMQVDLVA